MYYDLHQLHDLNIQIRKLLHLKHTHKVSLNNITCTTINPQTAEGSTYGFSLLAKFFVQATLFGILAKTFA